MSMIKCPRISCGLVFDGDKTFWWGLDINGDPTVENMTCPRCGASTSSFRRNERTWSFDSFKEAEEFTKGIQ
jgi:hypothetical protein